MGKKIYVFSLLIIWSAAVAASLLWNLNSVENSLEAMVLNIGRSFFQEIETTRLWNAMHGGVYVPITEETRPNPYLQVSDRDVITTEGIHLTKINPAYMTRQIAAIAKINSEIQYHITSLNTINPSNEANEWETGALHAFENGLKEVFNFSPADQAYRFMGVLPVKKSCLICHSAQNYKLGDIRGGISVTIPAGNYLSATQERKNALWFIHGVAFFIGGGLIFLLLFIQNKYTQEKTNILNKLNRELEDRVRERTYELQYTQEKLFVTLQSIGDGVITTDIEGRITFINKNVEKLTGWHADDAFGLPLPEVFRIIDEKTGVSCDNPIEQILASGQVNGITDRIKLITKNGNRFNIEYNGAPLFDKNNQIIGIVLVFRDVTEKLKTAAELLKVKKLESIGVLAGGIAHDFNNILAAILGNVELAETCTDSNSEASVYLNESKKAAIRAKGLTQQLLTFAKGGDPVKRTSAIGDIIIDSASFVLHGSSIVCDYHIPDDLWQVDVDAGQISQVIQNIVINACQAMPEGGKIEISCINIADITSETSITLPGNAYIKIMVQDNGCGIAEKYIEKIFDPYFTTKQAGSGLGLSISHSIISKHGGLIAVESKPGEGAAFTIYLPASRKKSDPIATGEALTPEIIKSKILIMDDEEFVRNMASQIIERFGHEAIQARDGREAIKIYTEHRNSSKPVDVIIMDLTVPGGMGGKDTIQEILKLDPDVKAIVSSGYSNDPVMANYRQYGFKAAIAKPFLMAELKKILSDILR